jgi:hypothetical protein
LRSPETRSVGSSIVTPDPDIAPHRQLGLDRPLPQSATVALGYSDPFGLAPDTVNGDAAAMKAYADDEGAMLRCSARIGCDANQANNAASGLNTLAAAEADPSITVHVKMGSTGVPVDPHYTAGTMSVTITLDAGALGSDFSLAGVAVHEVYEHFKRFEASGPYDPNTFGPARYPAHSDAVRFTEDPALLGAGLPSRTSRSPYCDTDPAPRDFSAAPVCGL